MDRRLSYCASQVRRHDYDRYLCALFAPRDRREALLALYAFNVEVARTREAVSEPMLGQIRLQWWRDAVAGLYAGDVRHHEVVRPLADAVAAGGVSRHYLDRLINGREFDLGDAPPRTLADLEAYAEGTSSALVHAALEILDAAGGAADTAAHHLGIAWGLVGLVRAVPYHARAGRQYLPADVMEREGARSADLFALRPGAALARVVELIAAAARDHLSRARAVRRDVPRQAVSALLPGILADLYLRRLARSGYDPFSRPVAAGDAARQWRLLAAALRNRY